MFDRIKGKLPGEPVSISFGINFNFSRLKKYGPKPKLIHQIKAKPLIGWPGQYMNWATTFFKLGPFNASIYWRPFDRLSDEEYFTKYGTYDNVELTKWDLDKIERRKNANL